TEMFHHRVRQIEGCHQLCPRLFPDVDCITDVIGMTVRNQDEIDMLERGDFGFRIFENRIREPGIDEQNFSARGHNLESRLTIPSELRIHEKSRNRKAFVRQELIEKNDEARMPNREGITKPEYCRTFL